MSTAHRTFYDPVVFEPLVVSLLVDAVFTGFGSATLPLIRSYGIRFGYHFIKRGGVEYGNRNPKSCRLHMDRASADK
jgi:hypothetical protein